MYKKIILIPPAYAYGDWKWEKTLNFDSAWKMMADPTLENWKFIFDTSDLKKYF